MLKIYRYLPDYEKNEMTLYRLILYGILLDIKTIEIDNNTLAIWINELITKSFNTYKHIFNTYIYLKEPSLMKLYIFNGFKYATFNFGEVFHWQHKRRAFYEESKITILAT